MTRRNGLPDLSPRVFRYWISVLIMVVTTTLVEDKMVNKFTWYQTTSGLTMDFLDVSSDMWACVLDTRVKKGTGRKIYCVVFKGS